LQYLKKRALRRIENQRAANPGSNADSSEQTEPKMKPKKISGIVTIPQHQQALQLQMAQMQHNYGVYF